MSDLNSTTSLIPHQPDNALALASKAANAHAAKSTFEDYLSRKADNTIRRQLADLNRFADFLADVMAQVDQTAPSGDDLQHDPQSWKDIEYGLVKAWVKWMISQGDAMGSINVRLSTVKTYAKLAAMAGVLTTEDVAMIRFVQGYSLKEAKRVNERRDTTRRGDKKAQSVHIDDKQARKLKNQPDTPQGRRDSLLMCLLLDHGLRCGEVAGLHVSDFDLKAGELRFYRPKVDKEQTHKLSADTLRAARAWFDSGDAPLMGDDPVLRGSRKGGALTHSGMLERAITRRVEGLGESVGFQALSR